jgi:hypothetical protein
VTYRRALRTLAEHLGCEPTEEAVYGRRRAEDPSEYASRMLRATGTQLLLVDDGYPPADVATSCDELGELAGCEARPVLRIERVADAVGSAPLEAVTERLPRRARAVTSP